MKIINHHRKTKTLLVWLAIAAIVLSGCVNRPKAYHVGVLSGMGSFAPAVDGFKAQMAQLGYVEGQNIFYDVQSTEADIEAYKSINKSFVNERVDLIFSFPTEASMEAKTATQGTNIPVIFLFAATDVEGSNLIKSTREPGGNITGVRYPNSEIASKRFQILLELVPKATRIFVPYFKDYPTVPRQLEIIRPMATSKGIELIEFATTDPEELQTKLESFVSSDGTGIDAILMLAEPLVNNPKFYTLLGKFCYDHQIPIGGGLMNVEGKYGSIFGLRPDPKAAGKQAAFLADKIFKGTPAGTIPVVTPESLFQIDMKAAQQLGVTVPEGLLSQANEIIR